MSSSSVEVVLHAGDRLGETPLWCKRTGRVWWLDIERPRVQSWDPTTGRHEVHLLEATWAGSLGLCLDGRLLVGLDTALHLYDPVARTLTPFCQVEATGLGTRLNDGRVDVRGRFWVGTMDEVFLKPKGSLYRVEPNGRVERLFGDVIVCNSIATSPDNKTLYFADTRRFLLFAFDLDIDDGVITNRRVLARYEPAQLARPDGASVDSDGCLWSATYLGGRLIRYTPDGRVDRVIELPVTNPTCVCFGGPGLDTLFVTSASKMLPPNQAGEAAAGALLALRPGVAGLPEHRFGSSC